jgi:serine phosphatase RsbU (regulator of sigma subunit)
VVVTSAGHPPPLIVTATGAYPAAVRHGLELGMFPGRGRWEESVLPLPAGAGLLLYTDGALEGFAIDGTRLGENRFVELASRLAADTDPVDYVDAILQAVQDRDDGRHNDDSALLYITRTST